MKFPNMDHILFYSFFIGIMFYLYKWKLTEHFTFVNQFLDKAKHKLSKDL